MMIRVMIYDDNGDDDKDNHNKCEEGLVCLKEKLGGDDYAWMCNWLMVG